MAGYVLEGWILFEEHYAILRTRRFGRIGVGVHVADGQFWATALFCE